MQSWTLFCNVKAGIALAVGSKHVAAAVALCGRGAVKAGGGEQTRGKRTTAEGNTCPT